MNGFGFPRCARLLASAEFKRVFDARCSESNRYFRIHRAPPVEPGSDPVRLGLAIAKRVARRAVDRNRLKRLARETFRHRRGHLPPGDYVVLARPAAVTAVPQELRDALDQLWLRFESQ